MDKDGPQLVPANGFQGEQEAPQVVSENIRRKQYEGLQVPQSEPPQYAQDDHHTTSHRDRQNPFGLSPMAFGALVFLIATIIVGAVVGGAVGGALGSKNSSQDQIISCPSNNGTTSPSTTSPANTTNYVPVAPTSVASLALPCPEQDGTTQTSLRGVQYKVYCYAQYNGPDLALIVAYSASDCMLACSNANRINPGSCAGIYFNSMLGYEFTGSQQDGNCWLRSSINYHNIGNGSTVLSAIHQ